MTYISECYLIIIKYFNKWNLKDLSNGPAKFQQNQSAPTSLVVDLFNVEVGMRDNVP